LARLRNQRFFALAELNAAIMALLGELNGRPDAAIGRGAAASCSMSSTGRRWLLCRPNPTFTPSGVSAGSRSTITSTSTATTTRCRTACCASRFEARITQRTVELVPQGRACRFVTCWAAPVAATPP